jgi:opacity protein-like surface antigen
MKRLIIILAIVACASIAQAQNWVDPICRDNGHGDNPKNSKELIDMSRARYAAMLKAGCDWSIGGSDASLWTTQRTEYPPEHLTIKPFEMPEGPTHGYKNQRGWDIKTGQWVTSPYTNNW